jgi:polygalacturonase
MTRLLVLLMGCALLALAPLASAATLHVPSQYPTIQAGMDAAVGGDTVLVACGVYVLVDPITMKSGVTLRSETGTPDCVVLSDYMGEGLLNCWEVDETTLIEGISFTDADYNYAVACGRSAPTFRDCDFYDNHVRWTGPVRAEDSSPTFIRCQFRDNSGPDTGGILIWGGSLRVIECTFRYNASSCVTCWEAYTELANCTFGYNQGYAGLEVNGTPGYPAEAVVNNCLIAFGRRSIYCEDEATANVSCSDFYGNAVGDWVGCVEGQLGIAGNISADPLFCDPGTGDLHLDCASPCAPFSPPNPECDLIGAWPVGCGGTRIEMTTWGALKGMFR